MLCPFCENRNSRVIDTDRSRQGGVRRRRECQSCHERYTTHERPVQTTPYLIKRDGRREGFDQDKLERGVRVACAKRPVSAASISRMVGEIAAKLESMRKLEVSSRIVGDMVVGSLKHLDQIAYIRYAIVYLGLDDLKAVRDEIDGLLALQA